jgi:hypothetical protein
MRLISRLVAALLPVAFYAISAGAETAQKPADLLDAAHDSRLATRITLRAPSKTVSAVLAELQRLSGVSLIADASVAEDRLIVFARNQRLDALLKHVALLHGWTWERLPNMPAELPAYRLYKPRSTVSREAREQRRWHEGRNAYTQARQEVMLDLINAAVAWNRLTPPERAEAERLNPFLSMAAQSPQGEALFGLLESFDPSQREALAESSLEPIGIISATNQSHIAKRIRFSIPFNALPPNEQSAITKLIQDARWKGDLQSSTVGLVTNDGGISLAIAQGQEIWWSGKGLGAPPYPEQYYWMLESARALSEGRQAPSINWLSPEVIGQMEKKYGIELRPNPYYAEVKIEREYAERPVSFKKVARPPQIEGFLEAIHDQIGLTVIADGLLRTSRVNHPWTLQQQDKFALEAAARELSRTFHRRIWTEGRILKVQSRRYAIEKLYDVPDSRVHFWTRKRKENRGLTFADLAAMAERFSLEQLETLADTPPTEGEGLQAEAQAIRQYLPMFHLWNTLENTARQHGLTEGLPLRVLTQAQTLQFWRIYGLAQPAEGQEGVPGGGLRISLDGGRCRVFLNAPLETGSLRQLTITL